MCSSDNMNLHCCNYSSSAGLWAGTQSRNNVQLRSSNMMHLDS
ncbi:hypothetical protein NC652_012900 [Populus alba x Populus x berolinensis]|nr:hypothetical protein NC652_012900 [Populus alba x Populus x berolinensis]